MTVTVTYFWQLMEYCLRPQTFTQQPNYWRVLVDRRCCCCFCLLLLRFLGIFAHSFALIHHSPRCRHHRCLADAKRPCEDETARVGDERGRGRNHCRDHHIQCHGNGNSKQRESNSSSASALSTREYELLQLAERSNRWGRAIALVLRATRFA